MRPRCTIFFLALILLAVLSPIAVPQAHALQRSSPWQLDLDFSTSQNPSNDMQFGWKATPTSAFEPFTQTTTGWNGVTMWVGSAGQHMWRNTSGQAGFGVAPDEVSLHPGQNSEYTTVRWTAPRTMWIYLWVRFGAGDTAELDYYVQYNQTELFHERTTQAKQYQNLNFKVNAGATIDILVGGGYNNGNTPVNIGVFPAWEPTLQFDATHNPALEGGWRYGTKVTRDGAFQYPPQAITGWNGVPMWMSATGAHVWKNTSWQAGFGVGAGQVSLHPGPNGEWATLRWTAPYIGWYYIKVSFKQGDRGAMSYAVQHNETLVFSRENNPSTDDFAQDIWLSAGDTIDIMVGPGAEGNGFGNTPVEAWILGVS